MRSRSDLLPTKQHPYSNPIVKRYFAKNVLEDIRDIFPNYLTYTYVIDAHSDFIYRFLEAINFIAPAKRIREKAYSKP